LVCNTQCIKIHWHVKEETKNGNEKDNIKRAQIFSKNMTENQTLGKDCICFTIYSFGDEQSCTHALSPSVCSHKSNGEKNSSHDIFILIVSF
jgi:hypothetical protein